jgi:hypothetical protein
MIWRGIGLLVGAAALVVLGVAALALVVVPNEPRFSDAFIDDTNGEAREFVATAVGARLEITGAREATVTLDRTVSGPSFGIGDSTTRIFFERDPLTLHQMSHDGLAFFPEPEDCELTEGEHNEDVGLVAVEMSCPELTDIRDNGTISVEGVVALPSDLVMELELPDLGGVLTVGEENWEIVDPVLVVGPSFRGSGTGELGLSLNPDEPEKGVFLSYDLESGRLFPATLLYDGNITDLEGVSCSIQDETIMVVNPQAEVNELTLDCDDVEIDGLGSIDIGGTIVYQKLYMTDG